MEGKNILIIEDEEVLARMYQKMFAAEGFKVTLAGDGQTGLDKIKTGGFDFILLDLVLPNLDGLAILQQIKNENLKSKNGPIIVLTNLEASSATKEAMESGADDYIVKSQIEPQALVNKIKNY